MGVFTFVLRSSGGEWTAKQFSGDIEASADSTFELQRKLVHAALAVDSSGAVQSSFSLVSPKSAVFQDCWVCQIQKGELYKQHVICIDNVTFTGQVKAQAAFGQAPPPNGITFFHAPAGRYSDGRLIIDFIAESLELPYLSAYLDSVGSNFSHGANFATAGSTVRPQNTTKSQSGYSPISLDVQFVQFSDFKTRSKLICKQGGVFKNLLPKEDYFSQALYTFDIGQNDLTAGYKLNLTTEQVQAYIPDVLGQFSNVIRNVYGEGGRSFWIHNTGPLGCLPYMLDRYPMSSAQMDKSGCASPFNEVAQYFNRKLKEAVLQLREELPEAAITYVDVYTVKYTLISHAKKYGFEQGVIACCGDGGKYNFNNEARCGATKMVNGKKVLIAKSCKDPKVRIIWDGIHYTEAANEWIFQQISHGSFSDPPVPLNMACHAHPQARASTHHH